MINLQYWIKPNDLFNMNNAKSEKFCRTNPFLVCFLCLRIPFKDYFFSLGHRRGHRRSPTVSSSSPSDTSCEISVKDCGKERKKITHNIRHPGVPLSFTALQRRTRIRRISKILTSLGLWYFFAAPYPPTPIFSLSEDSEEAHPFHRFREIFPSFGRPVVSSLAEMRKNQSFHFLYSCLALYSSLCTFYTQFSAFIQ